jgi:dTDP-4-dehydrorhamnose reductase
LRILVFGSTGMLGQALMPVLQASHQVAGLGSKDCDIRDGAAVKNALGAYRPELVIDLAAYTDVDGCDSDPHRAEELNGTGTRNVAQACAEAGARMLYVSTDYVFDGRQEKPYCEADPPNPINVYGHSKLLGERYVQSLLDRYLIVRTSWLFGPKGRNFVASILKLARQQPQLRVVNDQRGSPTYVRHLSLKLAELVASNAHGIYHVTASGNCTWFEFAQRIVQRSGIEGVSIVPISSHESGRAARRPANSVLENQRLVLEHRGLLPHWEKGMMEYLEEIKRAGGENPFRESPQGM